jgi:hypothetical protein
VMTMIAGAGVKAAMGGTVTGIDGMDHACMMTMKMRIGVAVQEAVPGFSCAAAIPSFA